MRVHHINVGCECMTINREQMSERPVGPQRFGANLCTEFAAFDCYSIATDVKMT